MILPLLLAALQAAAPAPAPTAREVECADEVRANPIAARASADRWRINGGGFVAQQCAGLADAAQNRWAPAATDFEAAAHGAETARDARAAGYWAEAGNAWLAAGDPVRARSALDSALIAGSLSGVALGEARLDHARALVAAGDLAGARTDLDLALASAGADPLAWLLSATLARRANDLPRARKDIAEAQQRAPDNAFVQLEAGNIAARAGDEAAARQAWSQTVRLAPDTDQGRAAAAALHQFDAPAKP